MTINRLLSVLPRLVRPAILPAVACAVLASTAVITPAAAWWRGGVWIGVPPIVVGPPAYYPPPVYYPPPPAYYAPPPPAAYAPPPSQSAGQSCNAGPYVCPMDHPVASGSSCYCLSNNRTQVWGRAS